MVSYQQSSATVDNFSNIFIFLPLCWTTVHEKPETIPVEKHINRLQYRASRFERLSSNRGEFLTLKSNIGGDGSYFGVG
jgi:hypothetical protein